MTIMNEHISFGAITGGLGFSAGWFYPAIIKQKYLVVPLLDNNSMLVQADEMIRSVRTDDWRIEQCLSLFDRLEERSQLTSHAANGIYPVFRGVSQCDM